jgi:hypothetical protein
MVAYFLLEGKRNQSALERSWGMVLGHTLFVEQVDPIDSSPFSSML